MSGPNMAKKAKEANTRSKRSGVANRSPVEKAASLAKFAVTNPKTFSHFYLWGGVGGRQPNMLGGYNRASVEDKKYGTKAQAKQQFNRTLNTNKTGMRNTPETVFETQAPPSSQGKARAGTGIKRTRPGIENR